MIKYYQIFSDNSKVASQKITAFKFGHKLKRTYYKEQVLDANDIIYSISNLLYCP